MYRSRGTDSILTVLVSGSIEATIIESDKLALVPSNKTLMGLYFPWAFCFKTPFELSFPVVALLYATIRGMRYHAIAAMTISKMAQSHPFRFLGRYLSRLEDSTFFTMLTIGLA